MRLLPESDFVNLVVKPRMKQLLNPIMNFSIGLGARSWITNIFKKNV